MATSPGNATAWAALIGGVLSIPAIIISIFDGLPPWGTPVGILVLGVAAALLLHHYASSSHFRAVRNALAGCIAGLGLACSIASAVALHLVPHGSAAEPRGAPVSAQGPDLAGLQVQTPAKESLVPACLTVKGAGRIPAGYQLWVANLNDSAGEPDPSELFNWRQAEPIPLSSGWQTTPFGVGLPKNNSKYWIFVFLLTDQTGSALQSIELPKTMDITLTHAPDGAQIVDEIPVTRAPINNC